MKKVFSIILIILIAFLASCNHDSDHSLSLKNDSEYHWLECECGEKKDVEKHQYGDWEVERETIDEFGFRRRTCTACGYRESEPSEIYVTINEQPGVLKTRGEGYYFYGDEITVVVAISPRYIFDGWYQSDNKVYLDPYKKEDVKVSNDLSYTFIAKERNEIYLTPKTHINEEYDGDSDLALTSVTILEQDGVIKTYGAGDYFLYDEVTVSATIDQRYIFDGWYQNDLYVSGNLTYKFIAKTEGEICLIPKTHIVGLYEDEYGEEGIISSSKNLIFTLDSNHEYYKVKGYSLTERKKLVIPEEYNGKPVKEIEKDGFAYIKLEEIEIPKSIEKIGEKAFNFCQELKKVTMNGTNVEIGESCFYGCGSLKDVKLPESIKAIPKYAFYNCTSLEAIDLPESVEEIGEYCFSDCSNLKSIEIPSNVSSIYSSCFANCINLDNVKFQEGIENIYSFAFSNCKIKKIYIPKSVKIISSGSFQSCDIEEIEVDSDNPIYDSRDNCNAIIKTASNDLILGSSKTIIPTSVTYIDSYAFYGNNCLKKINIPGNVVEIDYKSFGNCSNLTSVIFNDGLQDINNYAFSNCKGLTDINIPKTVTTIVDSAFNGCSNIRQIIVDEENSQYDSRNDCNAIINTANDKLILGCCNTIIPDGIKTIGSSSFESCENLKEIEIPESVKEIENWAFYACTSLYRIKMGDSISSISYGAFMNCASLEEIILPASLEKLSAQLFSRCKSLKRIVIPENVSQMENSVFSNCTNLETVILPSKISKIDYNIFYECSSLKQIVIPASVKELWYGHPSYIKVFYMGEYVYDSSKEELLDGIYFYSENRPISTGNYWHYVDGEIVIWK